MVARRTHAQDFAREAGVAKGQAERPPDETDSKNGYCIHTVRPTAVVIRRSWCMSSWNCWG